MKMKNNAIDNAIIGTFFGIVIVGGLLYSNCTYEDATGRLKLGLQPSWSVRTSTLSAIAQIRKLRERNARQDAIQEAELTKLAQEKKKLMRENEAIRTEAASFGIICPWWAEPSKQNSEWKIRLDLCIRLLGRAKNSPRIGNILRALHRSDRVWFMPSNSFGVKYPSTYDVLIDIYATDDEIIRFLVGDEALRSPLGTAP